MKRDADKEEKRVCLNVSEVHKLERKKEENEREIIAD